MPKKLPRPSKTDRYEPFKLPATEKPHRRGTVPLQLPPEDYETANARTFQQATGLRSPHPLSSSASRDRKRDEGSRRALQGSERTGIQRRIELEAAQAPPRRRIKYSPSGPFVSRKLSRPDHTHGAHVETEEYMDDIDNDDGFIGQQKHTTARETSTSRKRTLQGTQQHHQKRPADYENESEEVYADLDRGNETSPPSSPPPRTRRRSTSKPITQMTPVSAGVHQPQIQNSAMPDTRLYSSSYSDDSWKGFADEQDGNVSNSSIGLDIDAEDNIYDICSQPGHDHGSRGEDTESEDDEDLDDRGALADRLAELSNLLPSDHDDIELDPVIDGDDEMDENDMDRIRASLEEEEMFYEDSPEFRTLREEFEDPDAGNSSDPEDPPDSRESIHFFRITKAGITLQDLSTISYGSIRIEHRLSKSADKDLRLFYASVAGSVTDGALQPGEIRRARDTLSDITGLAVTRYGRCPDNCVAYDPDDTVTDRCPIEKCGLPRFKTDKTGKRVNAAEYGFISATHRIRALLSDHSKAELMYKYRSDAVERTRKENKVVDIWSGKIFQKLCKQGKFIDNSEYGFGTAADSYSGMRSKSFPVWPILLVNYSLPPSIRTRLWNMSIVGLIPGPKTPKRVDTFFEPLLKEFRTMQKGIMTWNEYLGKEVVSKAYLLISTSDMPARRMIMRTLGSGSKCYCEYCEATGLSRSEGVGTRGPKGMYCPMHYPRFNLPERVIEREEKFRQKGALYFDLSVEGDEKRRKTRFRTDKRFREVARFIEESKSDVVSKLYGIKGMTSLMKNDSYIFPFCCPLDYFHLNFMNVIKNLFVHFRGKFPPSEKAAMGNVMGHVNPRRPLVGAGGRDPGNVRFPDVDWSTFCTHTGENYVPTRDQWSGIFRDMTESRPDFPAAFGDFVNFSKVATCSKASTWEVWTFRQSPIYMRTVLSADHFEHYRRFIIGMELAGKYELAHSDVDLLERLINGFVDYYERTMYRYDFDRLSACLPTMHQIRHSGHTIRMVGPLTVAWQYPDERVIENIGMTTSPNHPNEALLNLILAMEQFKLVPYCIPDIGIGKGGVAGLGLDALGEHLKLMLEGSEQGMGAKIVTEDGKLKLVRLFAFFKANMDAHYSALSDRDLPGTNRNSKSRMARMRDRREYEYQPLSALRRLPAFQDENETGRYAGDGTEQDDGAPYTQRGPCNFRLTLPTGFDLQTMQMLDFEGDEYMWDGERRPNSKVSEEEDARIIRLFEPIYAETKRKNNGRPETTKRDFEGFNSFERDALMKYLYDKGLIPNDLITTASHFKSEYETLQQRGFGPIKWKALKISRFGVGRKGVGSGWRDSFKPIKIVGSHRPNPNRERSAARIQYLHEPLEIPERTPNSMFGEVLFFISVEDPRSFSPRKHDDGTGHDDHDGVHADRDDASDTSTRKYEEEMILALIKPINVEYTSDRLLLRVVDHGTGNGASGPGRRKRRNPVDSEPADDMIVIDARCIHGLIGLLTCEGRKYLIWEDNCWSTIGSTGSLD